MSVTEDGNCLSHHRNRITLAPHDVQMARAIRGETAVRRT